MIHFSRRQLQLTKFGPWIHIDPFLSSKECSEIIALMPERKLTGAMVSEVGVKNTSIRSTQLCALEPNRQTEWIFHKLEDAITQCNDDIYGYELHGFHEAIQLMQYKENDFYDWHMDFGNQQFSQRKLSVSVQLTDPRDYEGGDLEFFRNGIAPKDHGSMILFPSFMYHKVNPIVKGTRRALVGWVTGNPYR